MSKNKEYEQLQAEAAKSGMCNEDLPIITGEKFFPPDLRPPKKERIKCKTGVFNSSESAQNELDNQLAARGVPTPGSVGNAEQDSSLDSVEPMSDNSVPASPFQMTTARITTSQELEIGSRKRSQRMWTLCLSHLMCIYVFTLSV